MKKRSVLRSILGILLTAMLLTGCGASDKAANMTAGSAASRPQMQESFVTGNGIVMNDSVQMDAMEMPQENVSENGSTQVQDPLAGRKLIKTVNMTVETKEFDVLLETLETRVAQLGGYIESLETYNGSVYGGYRSRRNANLTIRIPQNQLTGFLDEVGNISNVIRRLENVQDVTLTYVDLESHKKVLEAERDRLIELIAQAEYLEDILTIESRLTEVRYQLESMESQLRTYDNKINYSTIQLYVEEVMELTPVAEETVWQRIAGGFSENLADIGDGLVEFAIWFVVTIPYFILWGIIIVIIIFLMKGLKKVLKSGKKKKSKSVETMSMQQENNGTENNGIVK
ncbi:MAG: DUF4349 domain-containing protein [Lachnospiraceae bacterium]|nr:DUF4349 domain-containing protein [Lachnospiraceae bacterium]